MRVAYVRDVQRHALLDPGDVREVPSVLGDERVDEQNARAGLHELPREARPDKAGPAGDQGALAAVVRGEARLH